MPSIIKTEAPATVELEPIKRLTRDLRRAMSTLTPMEARYIVDTYYAFQDYRKAAANQMRALSSEGEPAEVLGWLFANMEGMENEIKKALDDWSDNKYDEQNWKRVGPWSKGQYGIGPVIAAGLMAHIDVATTRTVSRIWSFAGLDPRVRWLGREGARKIVQEYALSIRVDDRPEGVEKLVADYSLPALPDYGIPPTADHPDVDGGEMGDEGVAKMSKLPVWLPSSTVFEIATLAGRNPETFYGRLIRDALNPRTKTNVETESETERSAVRRRRVQAGLGLVSRDELIALLARRPWNARLKTLCWHIGQSMMKFSGRDDCFYGHLYLNKKAEYIARNEAGGFAEHAALQLRIKNYGKGTIAYQHYIQGKCPPAHIDAMARRWTAKIFLSHWFDRAYTFEHGERPPKPYVFSILGHADIIEPPE